MREILIAFLLTVLALAILAMGLVAILDTDNKHLLGPYTVKSIGGCVQTSRYSGQCGIIVADKHRNTLHGYTKQGVSVGQKVWKECWTEDGVDYCFREFKPYPDKRYMTK